MRNMFRTAALFAALAGLFALIGAIVGYLIGYFWYGLAIMLVLSVIINIYSFYFSKRTALRHHRVRIITESEEPRLYRTVANVAQKAGIPIPEVGITENPSPNAFACGRGPKDAAVVATSGLLRLLSDDELEGVVAHEVAHIKNRDVMVMSIAATVAGIISYLANYLLLIAMVSGGSSRNNNGAAGLVLAIIGYITLPIAAMLIQLSISRGREYGADKLGAEITGNPMALASALKRLESGIAAKPMDNKNHHENYSDAHMWIEAPNVKGGFLSGMFSTHPKTADRVERLEKMAGKMQPAYSYDSPKNPFR